jgi:hypothetical protein
VICLDDRIILCSSKAIGDMPYEYVVEASGDVSTRRWCAGGLTPAYLLDPAYYEQCRKIGDPLLNLSAYMARGYHEAEVGS